MVVRPERLRRDLFLASITAAASSMEVKDSASCSPERISSAIFFVIIFELVIKSFNQSLVIEQEIKVEKVAGFCNG